MQLYIYIYIYIYIYREREREREHPGSPDFNSPFPRGRFWING